MICDPLIQYSLQNEMSSSSAEGGVAEVVAEVGEQAQVQSDNIGNGSNGGGGVRSYYPPLIGDWLCSILVQGLMDDDVTSIQQQLSLLKRATAATARAVAGAGSNPDVVHKHAAIRATMENLLKNTAGDVLNVEATVLIAATRHNCARTAAALMTSTQQGDGNGDVDADVDVAVVEDSSVYCNPGVGVIAHKTGDRSMPQVQHILTAKRNRLRLFGSAEGSRIRLDTSFQHRPVRCASKPVVGDSEGSAKPDRNGRHRCLICQRRTTTECSHCTASLCRIVRGTENICRGQQSNDDGEEEGQEQEESCFDRFHRLDQLPTPAEVTELADSRRKRKREKKQQDTQQEQLNQDNLQNQLQQQLQLQALQAAAAGVQPIIASDNQQQQQQQDGQTVVSNNNNNSNGNDVDNFHVQHGAASSVGGGAETSGNGSISGDGNGYIDGDNNGHAVSGSATAAAAAAGPKRGRGRPRGATASSGTSTTSKRQKTTGQ